MISVSDRRYYGVNKLVVEIQSNIYNQEWEKAIDNAERLEELLEKTSFPNNELMDKTFDKVIRLQKLLEQEKKTEGNNTNSGEYKMVMFSLSSLIDDIQ